MYFLVDSEGSVVAKNVSFDRLQDRIDRDMLDAWVLSESEYKAIYTPDDVFTGAGYGSILGNGGFAYGVK